jgi:hypothetical protein
MASYLIKLWLGVLLASTAAVTVDAVPARAVDLCLDNRAAQELISTKQIKTWPAIKALAGISGQYTEISRVQVCEQGGERYYVVNVQGPRGEVKRLVVNAITGAY